PNVLYYLQASTNLQTWTTVATNVSPSAKRPITVSAPNSRSLYRALVGTVSPTPPLLSAPSYAAGQFHFLLTGATNVNYIIEASPDLKTWLPVATNNSTSIVRPIDISAPAARSFYRALVGP